MRRISAVLVGLLVAGIGVSYFVVEHQAKTDGQPVASAAAQRLVAVQRLSADVATQRAQQASALAAKQHLTPQELRRKLAQNQVCINGVVVQYDKGFKQLGGTTNPAHCNDEMADQPLR